jgi:hypothetical protein
MTRRATKSLAQGELFVDGPQALYEVRRPVAGARPVDLGLKIKSALGEALKRSPESAQVIAARITELTGRDLSAATLYKYTQASDPDHQITLINFVAFVRATGQTWLWDVAVEDDGLVVLEGREAKLAQAGFLQQQKARIDYQLNTLTIELSADPILVPSSQRRRARR